MRAFLGPVILLVAGLLVWLVLAPLFPYPASTIFLWLGVIAVIVAIVWAVAIAVGYGGRRVRL